MHNVDRNVEFVLDLLVYGHMPDEHDVSVLKMNVEEHIFHYFRCCYILLSKTFFF